MENLKNIKESIMIKRKEMKLTQEQMANKLSISQPAYSYYETGDKPLPINQLYKVFDILGIDKDSMVFGSTETNDDTLKSIDHSLKRIADVLEKMYKK